MRGASYVPGEWCIVVADGGFAALTGDLPADLITRIWERLGRGNGLSPVLEALTGAFGTSLTAIPPFAVVLSEGSSLRIAVRGDISAVVTAGSSTDTVTGSGVTTWSERVLADAVSIDLVLPGGSPTDASYPVADGVVFASLLHVDLAAPAVGAVQTPPAAGGRDEERPDAAEPLASPPAAPAAAPAAPASALIDSLDVPAATDGETLVPVESTLGPQSPQSAPTGEYDHLWGETIARPIEEAAVRPAEGEAQEPDAAPAVGAAPSVGAAPAGAAPSPTSAPAPAASMTGPTAGDHDGATISVAEARALRDSGPGTPASAPHEAEPPTVAMPHVGHIRLSTGAVVALDRTVVIGRRPRSTRVTGTELPHLIAVESPQQDISRSHLEIRPEGDSVLVIDLHTTNGTTLIRAGKEPVRLHPGEQTVVVTGDVVDLGDGITVAFEDLP